MLIHALLDNKTLVGNGLTYTTYDGYFDGTQSDPKLNFFETATVIYTGYTSDLTNIETATNNSFGNVGERSLKISGFFRAKKSGTYRFYTKSDGASFLFINQQMVVNNGDLNYPEYEFGNINLTAGTYYQFDVYYGTRRFKYPPTFLSGTVDTTTLSGQTYGNGTYVVTTNSQTSTREARKLFASSGSWRPGGNGIGAYVQLELPNAIILGSYQVTTGTGGGSGVPTRFQLEGSNDNFATKVLLNTTSWGQYQGSKIITIDPPVNQAFKYFRLTNLAGGYSTGYIQFNSPLVFNELTSLTSGYLEPNADGTTSGSTNPEDFITNALGLDVFYLTDYSASTAATNISSLVYNNVSLNGRYKISLIGLYVDRANFATTKDQLLFISSPQLYVPGSGSLLLVLHEEPVSGDSERKDHHIFSDEFELDAELNGEIELTFQRRNNEGVLSNVQFQRALLVMQAKKID